MKTLLVFAVVLCAAACASASLPADWESLSRNERADLARSILAEPEVASQFNTFESVFRQGRKYLADRNEPDDSMTMKCAVCGIAMNEIEGLLAENMTMDEIQAKLTADLCDKLSGELALACSFLVKELPVVVTFVDNRWDVSVACIDLGLCTNDFPNRPETVGVPTYVIDLDVAPLERWTAVCSNTTYVEYWNDMVNFIVNGLPDHGAKIDEVGRLLNSLLNAEYAQEMQGCAQALGISYGWVTILNVGYEASDACTSAVIQNTDGTILHGRNLDFWAGGAFTQTLKELALNVEFQQGGVTQYTTATFAGYAGALSVLAPTFAATIDTRFYPNGILQLFDEIIVALKERNATLVAFLTRDAAASTTSWTDAVALLSSQPLIADVYYTVSGVNPDEGIVLARNRESVANSTQLDAANGKWYVAVTNYPWWEPQPLVDDRLIPLYDHLAAYGPSLDLDDLFEIFSEKPTLNIQTTYTFMSIPAQGVIQTFTRNCPYPCTQ
eukprot:Amastigsp_a174796_375.p2 type:complete len:499 gc:universal Amastigsp_a174796_375:1511-15(-)